MKKNSDSSTYLWQCLSSYTKNKTRHIECILEKWKKITIYELHCRLHRLQNASQFQLSVPSPKILDKSKQGIFPSRFVQSLFEFFTAVLAVEGQLELLLHPQVPPPSGHDANPIRLLLATMIGKKKCIINFCDLQTIFHIPVPACQYQYIGHSFCIVLSNRQLTNYL